MSYAVVKAMEGTIPSDLDLAPSASYRLGGHVMDNDNNRWDAFITFELLSGCKWRRYIKIVSDRAGTPFPRSCGLSVTLACVDRVKWLPDLMDRWRKHLDRQGNFADGHTTKGKNRRLECLEEWWSDGFTTAAKKGKAKAGDSATHEYILGTKISSSSDHIDPRAYKDVHPSSSTIISRFISGELIPNNMILDGKKCSVLQAIESAFLDKGVRINSSHAINPSRDMKENGLKSVLKSSYWTTKSFKVTLATSVYVLKQLGIEVVKESSTQLGSTKRKSDSIMKTENSTEDQDMGAIPIARDLKGLNDGKGYSERKREHELLSDAIGQTLPGSKRSKVEHFKAVGRN